MLAPTTRAMSCPTLGGNLELLALLKAVRHAGVAQPSGFKVGFDKRGKFLTFAVHHFFEESYPTGTQFFPFFTGELHTVDFLWNVDFPVPFGRIRIVAHVCGTPALLVELDKRREQFTVLAFHILHEDGFAEVKVFHLLLGEFHAPEFLTVEHPVVLEDVFDAATLGAYLHLGVEVVASLRLHAFEKYCLSFLEVVLFLLGELDTLDFIGDEYVLGFHRHNLIGEFVDAYEGEDNLTAAGFKNPLTHNISAC